ncbi:pyridoxamine 5'-phosphate oxidase family protein [Flavobacterium sp.]|uniref:pyridoxamine 5'-phosphate oxidase family protein n=1 Tax=Flavobacterium sp. TaxID=239 RepID=UPI003C44FDD0
MSTENLKNNKAIEKLKELAEDARICMFSTELTKLPVNSRPMGLQECDLQGNLWFLSSQESNKNFEISEDNRVQLYFMNNSSAEYLSIYGKAYIYKDQETIEEQWSPMAKPWFKDGKEDPNVTVIRVTPDEIYYWDTKAGKFMTMLSIFSAVALGSETDNDDGVEGKLNI